MFWRLTGRLAVCLGFLALGGAAQAQYDDEPKVEASFIAEDTMIAPGATRTVALREVIREGWHTYWINPGDSGAPTEILWQLPEGWSAGPIQWPYPARMPVGPLMNYGYENEVVLLTDITAPADAPVGETVTLPAKVQWLVCADICIPEDAELSVSFTVAAEASPVVEPPLFAEARSKLPRPAPWPARFEADAERFTLFVESAALTAARPREAVFFPYTDGQVESAAPQTMSFAPDGLVIQTQTGWQLADDARRAATDEVSGVLVLTGTDGRVDAFEVLAVAGEVPAGLALSASLGSGLGIMQALFFAFLGGLILNLMPCVLPVLSMKALALASKSHVGSAAKIEALSYGAGVLVTFLALAGVLIALRAGGAAVGWGFQLQHPIFITVLALVMLAVGLNLSGLYEIGAGRFAGAGQKFATKGGVTGSFLTGLLAVVVATPCTAPFMAAALGFALTQSAGVSLAVFAALAVGFAFPFVMLGFSPATLRLLPRPGPWLVSFRQVLAFPMYGAAAWLLWVLSQQVGPDGLFAVLTAALMLSFAAWCFGASRRSGSVAGLVIAAVALLITTTLVLRLERPDGPVASAPEIESVLGYEPFSTARLAELRSAGTPIFVNATAAWCITCLLNERVALSGQALADLFAEEGVVALKADWTNRNPEITELLAAHGRNGVPLYLYFAPHAAEAIVLPQILTAGMVVSAVRSHRADRAGL
ncbi:MAG: thioredoxin family protein [Proteobacteria bacterium]|nr:thioredoxin family protein [Pseudomonadota bacterium]